MRQLSNSNRTPPIVGSSKIDGKVTTSLGDDTSVPQSIVETVCFSNREEEIIYKRRRDNKTYRVTRVSEHWEEASDNK